jgi:hypothetical protein
VKLITDLNFKEEEIDEIFNRYPSKNITPFNIPSKTPVLDVILIF